LNAGYYPVFSFLSSLNGLIDLASVGLIGQKAGFSTPIEQQLRSILDVVGNALKDVSTHAQEDQQEAVRHAEDKIRIAQEHEDRRQLIMQGGWHDGRLDCIAGNGVMSELGFGEERMTEADLSFSSSTTPLPPAGNTAPIEGDVVQPSNMAAILGRIGINPNNATEMESVKEDEARPVRSKPVKTTATELDAESELIKSLPIVVLKNFAQKTAKGDLWNVMAEWGASLIENRVSNLLCTACLFSPVNGKKRAD